MNFPQGVCISISYILDLHTQDAIIFGLGGTTRKGPTDPRSATTKRPNRRRRRKPSTGRTLPLAVWTLDPGSLNLSGGVVGRWVVPGSGREGGSRVGVEVFCCFLFWGGRGNMVNGSPKICLPVIPVSQVKVLVFGWYVLRGSKF